MRIKWPGYSSPLRIVLIIFYKPHNQTKDWLYYRTLLSQLKYCNLKHISAYCCILHHYIWMIITVILMSIEDLAVYLGDSKRTIYKYIANGDCPPYIKITSKNIKFDKADVDKWLESKKVQPNSTEKK